MKYLIFVQRSQMKTFSLFSVTLSVAFCSLMSATTANAVAVAFAGAAVPKCVLYTVEKTYVCLDDATTDVDTVKVAGDYVVIMLGSGVMKGDTITLLAGSAVQGDLDALTTVTMTAAQVTGNVTALTTFTMTAAQVDRNVWAGTTGTLTNSHVGRNLSVGTTSELNPGSYVCQNLEGRQGSTTARLGVASGGAAYVYGNLTTGTTVTINDNSAVYGNVTAGTTVTASVGGNIHGNVTAGTVVTFSSGCIGGTIDSDSQTPAAPVVTDSHRICPLQKLRTRCSPIIYMREDF
jgi:cytoskeletal protein CcmA (bactofilin family)